MLQYIKINKMKGTFGPIGIPLCKTPFSHHEVGFKNFINKQQNLLLLKSALQKIIPIIRMGNLLTLPIVLLTSYQLCCNTRGAPLDSITIISINVDLKIQNSDLDCLILCNVNLVKLKRSSALSSWAIELDQRDDKEALNVLDT